MDTPNSDGYTPEPGELAEVEVCGGFHARLMAGSLAGSGCVQGDTWAWPGLWQLAWLALCTRCAYSHLHRGTLISVCMYMGVQTCRGEHMAVPGMLRAQTHIC